VSLKFCTFQSETDSTQLELVDPVDALGGADGAPPELEPTVFAALARATLPVGQGRASIPCGL